MYAGEGGTRGCAVRQRQIAQCRRVMEWPLMRKMSVARQAMLPRQRETICNFPECTRISEDLGAESASGQAQEAMGDVSVLTYLHTKWESKYGVSK